MITLPLWTLLILTHAATFYAGWKINQAILTIGIKRMVEEGKITVWDENS